MNGGRGFRRMRATAQATAARVTRISRYALPRWRKRPAGVLLLTALINNRSLGTGETGGRVALPVLKEIALRVYTEKLVGPAPQFPAEREQSISDYLEGDVVKTIAPLMKLKDCCEAIAAPHGRAGSAASSFQTIGVP